LRKIWSGAWDPETRLPLGLDLVLLGMLWRVLQGVLRDFYRVLLVVFLMGLVLMPQALHPRKYSN